MAFKMKGWSGSPIKQKPKLDLSTALANIQKNISNTVKGFNIKPQSESSGFGLTNTQKAQAKKLGISEYQWKTEMGINASTRHKKRMFEKKHKLGKYAVEPMTMPDEKTAIDMQGSTAETYTGGFGTGDKWKDIIEGAGPQQEVSDDATTEVDYGTGATTKDWKHESSTGWSLHELTQERKNLDVGSAEYKKIQDAINAAYKAGPPVDAPNPDIWKGKRGTPEHKAWVKKKHEESDKMREEQKKEKKTEKKTEKTKKPAVGTLNNPHNYYPGAKGVPGQYYTNQRDGRTIRFIPGHKNKSFSYEYVN